MVISRGGGRGGGSRRDKVKPKRGGPRHFTVHPRDLYMKEGRPEGEESSEEASESESGSDCEDVLVKEIGTLKLDKKADSDSDEEEEVAPQKMSHPPRSNPNRAPVQAEDTRPASQKAPHELTRREREAIEKERARQHFLKMKEKEDAARLAVIRKQREEAAAAAAAEKKAKEEARMRKK